MKHSISFYRCRGNKLPIIKEAPVSSVFICPIIKNEGQHMYYSVDKRRFFTSIIHNEIDDKEEDDLLE
jgi:hypothetical protein